MRSIRLSLIIYFVVLLALVLGSTSALTYQTTRRLVQDKETTTREQFAAEYSNRSRAIEDELDRRLLQHAQTLASLVQSQWGPRVNQELTALGILSAGLNLHGYLLMPLWVGESVEGGFGYRLRREAFFKIQFAEDVMARHEEGSTDFFQIYSAMGNSLQHAPSMVKEWLSLRRPTRETLGLFQSEFEDIEPSAGPRLRCVTLKVPVSRFRFSVGRPPGRFIPNRTYPREGPRPPPNRNFADRSLPAIFIQCAAETGQRDQLIADVRAELDRRLDDLTAESAKTLAGLQDRLLWIGFATFAAAVVGGCLLIGVGMKPLRRLSDAVSRVSEKDFNLPLDGKDLPLELRPIRDRLAKTLELLKRAFSREKQAAADMSHELRTPLAALLTTIEVTLRKPRQASEYERVLNECEGIGRQMNRMVERLLVLARLDAGVDAVRPREIEAAALAAQCIDLVRPLADARGVTMELHSKCPVRLTTDPDKVREVLTNLLHNAIEYNRPGGRIDVTVERRNGDLELEVADTGVGMPETVQAHVFERFYRADASRHGEGMHTGLGLAIVKGYVDRLGGRVGVKSQAGTGSQFLVQLPIS